MIVSIHCNVIYGLASRDSLASEVTRCSNATLDKLLPRETKNEQTARGGRRLNFGVTNRDKFCISHRFQVLFAGSLRQLTT
jgi:hypothetical protein